VARCGLALGGQRILPGRNPLKRWSSVSPLVNLPFNAVAADGPNGEAVFAASDMGIRRSSNGGGSWTHMGPEVGMPNVVANDLELDPSV
jgi:hypothetical protein